MSKHTHADLMLQYAQDAQTTDTPWELWQMEVGKDHWDTCERDDMWWIVNTNYRRKPKTININGYEVPEPLRLVPEEATLVYLVHTTPTFVNQKLVYSSGTNHDTLLNLGLLHSSQEAAELHAKALLSFTVNPVE